MNLITIPYRFRVLVLLCSLTALTYLDRICISIVGVRLKSDLHLSNEQFGWVLAAFALAYAVFEIPSGMLGDRIGPRKIFIRIVIWWSLFTALTGIVNGLIALLVVRFLFGVGESGTYPNSILAVSRWFPVSETGKALSWVGIGSQLGAAIAPLIIVPIAAVYGWRTPFFVIGSVGMLWVWISYKWFRDFPAQMKTMPSPEKKMIESSCRHNDHQQLVPWKQIFSNSTLWPLMAMYFCCQWANYFFIAWMPVYLQEGRGFSENSMKEITSVLFVVGISGFLAGGAAGDWFLKHKGLKKGRRLTGMLGLGACSFLLLMAAVSSGKVVAPPAGGRKLFILIRSHGILCGMCGYWQKQCRHCHRSYEFFRADGCIFSCPYFWKDCTGYASFRLPSLFTGSRTACGMPALARHQSGENTTGDVSSFLNI